MMDQYGRSITALDLGDGTTKYSVPGIDLVRASSISTDQIIAEFNALPYASEVE